MKRVIVAALVAALLLGSLAPPASAGPGEDAVLVQIIAVLRLIHSTLDSIRETVATTRDTLHLTYPLDALKRIGYFFEEVRSIKDEVSALSCGWRFSVRTQRLWKGLFDGARLCKPEFQNLFGSSPEYVLQDLDEYYDYSATRRLNMVATRVERGPAQQTFLRWLLREAERGRRSPDDGTPYGPGYSQRLSAIGAAALGNVLLEQGDTLTAQLELAQERVIDKRLRQKLQTEMSMTVYAALAGEPVPGSKHVGGVPR
jgi:hypothetical protein